MRILKKQVVSCNFMLDKGLKSHIICALQACEAQVVRTVVSLNTRYVVLGSD